MATAPSPEISVIIPVRNGARTLPPLLESLHGQTLAGDRFEVIVVDNGSEDQTALVASRYGVKVVSEPVPNRSGARNRGAAAAAAPLLAFTDADCEVDPRWLEELLAHAQLGDLLAGEVVLRTRARPNAVERFEKLWRFGQEAWVGQGWAATANLMVSAGAFAELGGFDTTWRHIGEDVDFCFRARAAGLSLAFCGSAIVYHDGEQELAPLLKRCFRHGYSVNQAFYRLGAGYRAWRDPLPMLSGARALERFGQAPAGLPARERRSMALLARGGYAARVAGSLWAELAHAR